MNYNQIFDIASLIQKEVEDLGLHRDTLISSKNANEILVQEIADVKEQLIEKSGSERVSLLFDKFHQMAIQMKDRRDNRESLLIKDEYDVQDLLHSLLRIYFNDVRPEDWCPSYAGKSYRTDFVLPEENIVIEVKITRSKVNNNKRISDELILDIEHYRKHPNCELLMCFVYDSEHLIKNPVGFENDIARKEPYPVIVKVNPKP